MITDQEKKEIIDAAVEKALLMLPEVVSRLFMEKTAMKKMAEKFFGDNPTFKDNKDIVGSVLEELESKNPGKAYSEILNEAGPIITSRISQIGTANLSSVQKPSDLHVHGDL